jgi:sulfur carrier protein
LQLIINGEERDTAAADIAALLAELGLNPGVTVVELNGRIVDRSAYPETGLVAGDALELVRIVGGG